MLKAQTLTEVSCDKVVPSRPCRHKMTHDMVLCFSLTNDIVCYNMVLKTRHGTCYHVQCVLFVMFNLRFLLNPCSSNKYWYEH